MSAPIQISDEVAGALACGNPVVALETTLVTHGFSGGRGLAAALESERRVRAAGATPATIGIADGQIRIGMDQAALERFAQAGPAARKTGARDIAACLVQRALGSLTVGGTLAVCRKAGLRFMATGGIGGVHRGFAQTMDISADLVQIAGTPALVVCSGAKAILDVAATAELLETLGVPVLGWRVPTLPMFYTADGGPPVPAVVTTLTETAAVAAAHWQLNPTGGLLLARPPTDGIDLGDLVTNAVDAVQAEGVTGQSVTPAILARIEQLSQGRNVAVNQALIAENAELAAQIAVAFTAVG